MINYTEPKLKDFKCFKLPINELSKCKELLILGNVYNFFGTYKDGDLFDFTQTPWSGEGAADNFMKFGQFVMNGGHATIIASKETCNYYRTLYKEFYKAGFGTTHPKVVLFEIDDTKFLKGNFKIKEGKEEKLVKGEYFWAQGKDGKWNFNYPDFLKSFFENGEKRMFDLIIANPPYGDDNKGTFPRKIIEVAKKCAKESIWLLPTTYFQYDNMFKEIADFKRFSKIESQNLFEGVACPPLSVVRFDGKIHNLFNDKFDYSLPRTTLVNAFRQYNKMHPSCCAVRSHFVNHSNLGAKDGKSPSSFDPETFKLYNQDFYERTLVFGMYWISNGIHTDEGNAIDNFWNYKLENYEDFQAKVKELDAHPDLHAATFKSKQEKQNCEKYRHGKLYNKLLSEFDNGGSIEYIRLCIPNLDWSRSWTDSEILKELGLPEDFLEKKE